MTKSALPSSSHLSTSWDHSHFMSTGVGFVCRGVVLVQVESILFRNVRVLSEFVNHVQAKSQLGRYRVWPSVKFYKMMNRKHERLRLNITSTEMNARPNDSFDESTGF